MNEKFQFQFFIYIYIKSLGKYCNRDDKVLIIKYCEHWTASQLLIETLIVKFIMECNLGIVAAFSCLCILFLVNNNSAHVSTSFIEL